jgi:hypothetical protein
MSGIQSGSGDIVSKGGWRARVRVNGLGSLAVEACRNMLPCLRGTSGDFVSKGDPRARCRFHRKASIAMEGCGDDLPNRTDAKVPEPDARCTRNCLQLCPRPLAQRVGDSNCAIPRICMPWKQCVATCFSFHALLVTRKARKEASRHAANASACCLLQNSPSVCRSAVTLSMTPVSGYSSRFKPLHCGVSPNFQTCIQIHRPYSSISGQCQTQQRTRLSKAGSPQMSPPQQALVNRGLHRSAPLYLNLLRVPFRVFLNAFSRQL